MEAALTELRAYLQDELSPEDGADVLGTLIAHPPDPVMQRVGEWAAEQSRARSIPVSDFLLHAMKKVYVTGELGLLDRELVATYLDRACTYALRICPPAEEDALRANLTAMRRSGDKHASFATLTAPPPARLAATPIAPAASDEEAQAAKRFTLIMERLTKQATSGQGQPMGDQQAFSQLLTMAATRSQTGQQFDSYVEQIRSLPGGKESNVFAMLGGGMPSWDVPNIAPGEGTAPAQVGAMEKIIDFATDPRVAVDRFRELVAAAIGKFNEGALAATVWMLSVAEDAIAEKKLDVAVVDHIRKEAVSRINAAQLRTYAENKGRHAAVKIVLEFFPTLHRDALFRRLRGEPSADVRRNILGFIEAYGAFGRQAALEDLDRELARPDVDTYYLRNLIYILHRVARESNETVGRELEQLKRASARGHNIYVIKEAATALALIRNDDAVKVLMSRLAEFEAILLKNDTSQYPIGEMQKLVDRLANSLARIGTQSALVAVAKHGLISNPLLGDARARLGPLSAHDLTFDPPTVELLLETLRDEIPGKLFGRTLKKPEATLHLVTALSGTRSDEIDELFGEIAERFSDNDIGRAAAQVLEKREPVAKAPAASEPAATLTGQLEFFGLPSVMQSLAEMRATGMLTLTTKQKVAAAKLIFLDGRFLNAQVGHIRGVDALYEALERPIAGTFAFVPIAPEKMKSDIEPREIMGLLLEGIRRNDELQRMLALIPDEMRLAKGTAKPTPHEEEEDAALVREVWLKASSGEAVSVWSLQMPIDTFRVRRLVAHWLEQGALVAMEPARY